MCLLFLYNRRVLERSKNLSLTIIETFKKTDLLLFIASPTKDLVNNFNLQIQMIFVNIAPVKI